MNSSQEKNRPLEKLNSMKKIAMPLLEKNENFNIVIGGKSYAGKTWALQTAPRPLVIDVFDKTALPALRPIMNEEDVFINLYTDDNPEKPTMFKLWAERYDAMRRDGVFDYIETHAVDSLTKMAESLLWKIIDDQIKSGKGRRTATQIAYRQPTIGDYAFQGEKMKKILNF